MSNLQHPGALLGQWREREFPVISQSSFALWGQVKGDSEPMVCPECDSAASAEPMEAMGYGSRAARGLPNLTFATAYGGSQMIH